MLAIANTGEIGRGFGKNAGEWTGRVEISKEEIAGSTCSMHGYKRICCRLKGENLSCLDNWSNLEMKRTPVLTLMSALNKTINGHVEVAILSSKD